MYSKLGVVYTSRKRGSANSKWLQEKESQDSEEEVAEEAEPVVERKATPFSSDLRFLPTSPTCGGAQDPSSVIDPAPRAQVGHIEVELHGASFAAQWPSG